MRIPYKRAEAGLVVILIIVIAVLFIGWLVNVNQRECNRNKDCSSDSYCGSDFSCHQYSNIQNTIVQYNFFWPALIIGAAILTAAWVFRRKESQSAEIKVIEKAVAEAPEEVEEISEPYYKPNSNAKVP